MFLCFLSRFRCHPCLSRTEEVPPIELERQSPNQTIKKGNLKAKSWLSSSAACKTTRKRRAAYLIQEHKGDRLSCSTVGVRTLSILVRLVSKAPMDSGSAQVWSAFQPARKSPHFCTKTATRNPASSGVLQKWIWVRKGPRELCRWSYLRGACKNR